MKKALAVKKEHIYFASKGIFWFIIGGLLALFFLVSFTFILFQKIYWNKIYPGVIVNGTDFGGKTQDQTQQYFANKNAAIANTTFTLTVSENIATVSAQQLHMGYDSQLLATQAYSVGRSSDSLSNFVMIFQAFLYSIHLPPSYTYDQDLLNSTLSSLKNKIYKAPVNTVFVMQNNRVTTFKPAIIGQTIDINLIKQDISANIPFLLIQGRVQNIHENIPLQVLKPAIGNDSASKYDIEEVIGEGTSYFQGSAPGRIHNVELATSRVNGVLIAPNEIFSFDKALGDVSQYTGYQQAYVIQNGKTVLGDGGGVCQVSTTFFRAILNAGLPIVERHAHAYRVEYYEEGGYPPGIDATVYVPSVDLKFKNDTGHWILVQTFIDPDTLKLTIDLYGVSDARVTTMSTPVITNETPAPTPLYQDDPTLPQGQIKQIDFAAAGANVVFTRQVIKDGKVLYNDTFKSNYQPWQAVYLRGTKS